MENILKAFFELLRAGLWEKDAHLLPYGEINYEAIQTLAEEQAVLGLIMAGMEHVVDTKVPRMDYLQFAGVALQIEKQNEAMNVFIADLFRKLETEGIKALLVKGQGIAQCYERPLLRMSGDVDLLLDEVNYMKAKKSLSLSASRTETENVGELHYGLWIGPWEVELHGTMRSIRLPWMDMVVDKVQVEEFSRGEARVWEDEGATIPMPSINSDLFFIFTHIIKHLYGEGIGLRQVCDWCRMLYVYREEIDVPLLEMRLRKARIMTEWQTFAALAVGTLGMPIEYMPFYSTHRKWVRKADKLLSRILMTGNFGHSIEKYTDAEDLNKYGPVWRYFVIVWLMTVDAFSMSIFPVTSLMIWWNTFSGGISHQWKRLWGRAK